MPRGIGGGDARRTGIGYDPRRDGLDPEVDQILYPTSTVGTTQWLPSDTTLAGDTSDTNTNTYAYLTDVLAPAGMTLNFQQHQQPWSNSPGATLTITWQQAESV